MFTSYFWEKFCKNCFSSGFIFFSGIAKVKVPVSRRVFCSEEKSGFPIQSVWFGGVEDSDSLGFVSRGTKMTKAVQNIPKIAKKSTCLSWFLILRK